MELLEIGKYYHIFNRGINSENIFKNEENRHYFLRLYNKHLSLSVTSFAYCLLNNHFHIAIRVDKESKVVTQSFSNFFNAYAKAINKSQNRTGSLFEKNFRRISIDSEKYLKDLILYIHFNPQTHFGIDYRKYSFSSYQSILLGKHTIINCEEVIAVFDSFQNFKKTHEQQNLVLEEKFKLE
ncbi:hypothetical protein [Christiangramia sp.]|uniref:hypothetical protein n=1 Tax=Christiangramia sp. TaxID=1931228 RepID=UPI002605BC01|nr:hypothetical protein [Christiangramia sp.]